MTMPQASYLVYQYPYIHDADRDDRLKLLDRYESIMDGFIIPQIKLMIGYGTPRFNRFTFNSTTKALSPIAYEMAKRDAEEDALCEKPIIAWTHLSDLACDVLDVHPSKEQIELLHERCCEMDDTTRRTTRELRQEIYETIWDLDMVLEGWDFIKGRQLRFYPSKPAHFERYTISK